MKRFLIVACCGIMLASIGSSCAQPRMFVGGGVGFGRPFPQQRFLYGPPVAPGFVRPQVFVAPRPRHFVAPRPWGGGWRRGGRWGC